jgi:transcriptional regulator of arginine metabolism
MYNLSSVCIHMKTRRQSLILQLLDREPIRNQEQLRRGLRAHGVVATQATISRDIKELGLVKRAADGAYQRASVPPPGATATTTLLTRAIADTVVEADRVQQFVVLKTPPAQANATAIAIDRARLADVVGTIAGDDTILVILRDPRHATAFLARVKDIIGVNR